MAYRKDKYPAYQNLIVAFPYCVCAHEENDLKDVASDAMFAMKLHATAYTLQ